MPRNIDKNRMNYGICLNDECPKCQSKEIQQVSIRRDFVCTECGKELRRCPPPKKGNKKLFLILGALIAIAAIVFCCLALFGGGSGKSDSIATDSISAADSVKDSSIDSTKVVPKKDTVVVHDTITETQTKTIVKQVAAPAPRATATLAQASPQSQSNGSLRLSYGKYSGGIKNGYPHGQGRLTYSTSRQINRNDMKGRTANAGDYIIGEFFNGFVVYGKHYDSEGNLLESLNFGVGSESSYDSK